MSPYDLQSVGFDRACGRLEFTHDEMFKRVMKNEDISKGVIGRILHKEIDKVEFLQTQAELTTTGSSKSMRLDTYVVESNGMTFDVEMQVGYNPFLLRRMRYYQGMMDTTSLKRGQSYCELRDCAVIFLCAYDPFGLGSPVYTVRRCLEGRGPLDTGELWLVVDFTAYRKVDEDPGLRTLLEYMATGHVDREDELQCRIAEEVELANDDAKWVSDVFSAEYTMREEYARLADEKAAAMAETMAEAIAEAKAEAIAEAKAEAIAEAKAEAEQRRLGALAEKLKEADRVEDLLKAVTDLGYREALYSELGI